ncbi:MAG: UDP-N-acetylglucosamine-1-phosphate transferase [Nitrososphaeria archaeon]|nr:UDP-N-acetylglucosamine-1-phosphate transferase [Nitrososphaeria archaeon]
MLSPIYFLLPILSFVVTFLTIILLIPFLIKRKMVVVDFHKRDHRMIPKPAGPAIFLGLASPMIILYFLTLDIKYFAIFLTTLIVFVIGLIDDLKVLGGSLKMVLTVFGSLPLLVFRVYTPSIIFPFFGPTRLTIVYPIIVLLTIPVVSNAINMIDVYNGTLSGACMLLSISQFIIIAFMCGNLEQAIFPLTLFMTSFAFFIFNRYPSKIFAGDSGSLVLGSFFGASTIITRTEIPSLVAFVPAILNGFYILASIKGFVEHRRIKERPVMLNEEGLLEVSKSKAAPVTLARLIVADGPMPEWVASKRIILLFLYSALLSIITAMLMRW